MKKSTLIVIVIGIVIIGILVLIKFILPDPNDIETETIYCGPNKTKPAKVFKNPTAAFPDFVKDYNLKVTSSVELIDTIVSKAQITGAGSLDYTIKAQELREKLNQESSRMQMVMRSNFFAFNAKPCDSLTSVHYFQLLKMVAEKNYELEKLRAELTTPQSQGAVEKPNLIVTSDTLKIKTALGKFAEQYNFY